MINAVKPRAKAAACVQFSTFGCGFQSRAAYMQCSESAKPMKAVWHDVTCTVKTTLDFVNVAKLFQHVNKHFSMQKSGRVQPSMDDNWPSFSSQGFICVPLVCNLSLGKVRLLFE